jgi:hypothetical protein
LIAENLRLVRGRSLTWLQQGHSASPLSVSTERHAAQPSSGQTGANRPERHSAISRESFILIETSG